jgi:hypothetical protein
MDETPSSHPKHFINFDPEILHIFIRRLNGSRSELQVRHHKYRSDFKKFIFLYFDDRETCYEVSDESIIMINMAHIPRYIEW